MNKMAFT